MDEGKALDAGRALNAAHTMQLTPNMIELRRSILVSALELYVEDELDALCTTTTFAYGSPARVTLDAELERARRGVTLDAELERARRGVTRPLPGRDGYRIDADGRTWYSTAWLGLVE